MPMKKSINVVLGRGLVYVGGYYLYMNAICYAEAGAAVRTRKSIRFKFNPVPYAMYTHSIECSLKAFLWGAAAMEIAELKNSYKHDLVKLWNKAKATGLGRLIRITEARENAISLLSPLHKQREFNYLGFNTSIPLTGGIELPSLRVLDRLAHQLLHEIEPYVKTQANKRKHPIPVGKVKRPK